MALNIPLPGLPGDALLKGLNTGSTLFSRYMQPIIQREQLAEQGKYHQGSLAQQQRQLEQQALHQAQQLALAKQQEARLAQNSALNRQLLQKQIFEHELKTNPKKLFEFIQQIKQQSGGNPMQSNQTQGMMPEQNAMNLFQGNGMPSNEEIENPTPIQPRQIQGISQPQTGSLFGDLTPDQQMMLQMAGIKIPTIKENPEQKRYAELQNKIKLEEYKTQQKKILKQEEADLKHEATKLKVIDAAKNDLPHLEANLKAIQELKLIAKNNPDLFGHSGLWGFGAQGAAERFAKTTNNPNAGKFIGLLTGPIAEGVNQLSSRGNQLALKTQLGFKPSFDETQTSALGKLDSMEKIAQERIEQTRKLSGEEPKNVVIVDPNGKRFKTTASNAAHLPEGWKRG